MANVCVLVLDLDFELGLDLDASGDLLLALELVVVASWTDHLVSVAGRLERPLVVDNAGAKSSCKERDADAERPRSECFGNAEFGLVVSDVTTGDCPTEPFLDAGDGLACRVGG